MPVDRSRVHARSAVICSACGAHVLRIAAMPPGKSAVWFKCPVCHTRAHGIHGRSAAKQPAEVSATVQ